MKAPKVEVPEIEMPKEDPAIKRERERQRRLAELERRKAGKKGAKSLTGDLMSIFGMNPGGGSAAPSDGGSTRGRIGAGSIFGR